MGFFQDYTEDRAIENATPDPRDPSKYRATWYDNLITGAVGGDAQGAIDERDANLDRTKGDKFLKSVGETRQSLGMGDDASETDLRGAYTKTTRTRTREEGDRKFEQGLKPLTMQLEAQGKKSDQQFQQSMEQLKSSERQATERLEAQMEESRNTRSQALDFRKMDKGDKAEERATALEIEQMRGNREDKRLKMQHDRYYADKKSSSMQALVAGLAALGAAFAL